MAPADLAAVARDQYTEQAGLARRAADALLALWALLDPTSLAASWVAQQLARRMFAALSLHQVAAASRAPRYVSAALAAQGAVSAPAGALVPQALAGIASDGRALESLLAQPLIGALTAIRDGADVDRALGMGASAVATIARTQVADAARAAQTVAMTVEPKVFGWIRMLVPPSCGRCAVLAGKWFGWNAGFQRHENCDCTHIAAAEDAAGDLRTDPKAYFESLSPADQARYFTVAGAQAIRLGADIGQVVNARRGALGLSTPGRLTDTEQDLMRGGRARGRLERVDVYGRQLYVTTEGTTVRGLAGTRLAAEAGAKKDGGRYRRARTPRLMPESILEVADGDRAEAVRLLQRFGYIL